MPFNNKRSAGVALLEQDPSPQAGEGKRAKKQVNNLRSELEKLKTQLAVTRMGLGRGTGSAGSGGGSSSKGGRGNGGGKGAGKGGKGGQHPRKDWRGRYVTNEDGVQICFPYHTSGCTLQCRNNRAHQCQQCLGFHQNSQCGKGVVNP